MGWDEEDNEMEYDWEDDFSNNILIYGDSKVGKTYVGAYKLKQLLDNDPTSMAYIINTDKGFAKPAKLHGLNKPEYKDRMNYYYVNSLKRAIDVINEIRDKVQTRNNPNDIVMFDLLSWIWDQSQKEFISDISGGEVVGFLTRAMKDDKKFGTFSGMQWQYVKKLDDMVSNYLSRNPICNIIAIARNKNVEAEYKIQKKAEDIWYEVGRPDSRKDIAFEFANIIKVEKFVKDEEIFRRFIIMGSRDYDPDYKYYAYSDAENFWMQVDSFIGIEQPKKKYPKVSNEEKSSMIVSKVKELYSESEGFSIGSVGELFPEISMNFIQEVIDNGVKNKKVFHIKEDVYSLKEPEQEVEKEVEKDDVPVKQTIKENKVEVKISKDEIPVEDFLEFLKTNYGEVEKIPLKEMIDFAMENNEKMDEDDILDVVNRCLDDGFLYEPELNFLSLVDPEKKEDTKVETVVDDDDDW